VSEAVTLVIVTLVALDVVSLVEVEVFVEVSEV
jgi:hypothetical protein